MSQGPFGSEGDEVPTHPLEELWYLQGEAEAQGPHKGHVIKEMIEVGSVGPESLVARVGATQWTPIADLPEFAQYLLATRRAPVKYAGFWIRVLAAMIDTVIFYIVALAGALVVIFLSDATGRTDTFDFTASWGIISVVNLVIALFYYIYFQPSTWQATPGKRICGIHLVRLNGRPVTRLLAFERCLSYIISALPLFFGFLMVAFTKEKRGLHDIICGTRVVYGKL